MIDDFNSPDAPRVDLSSLDPMRDAAAFDAAVARVMERAQPVLARYRDGRASVTELFSAWTKPLLVAAAVVGVVAAGALARLDANPQATTTLSSASIDASVAESIGVPATMAPYLAASATPSASTLLYNRAEE